MTNMISQVQEIGAVSFPAWSGAKVYMREFSGDGLPDDLQPFQKTVEQMTAGLEYKRGFLMVDESLVVAGGLHRRGGLHIDGAWHAGGHGGPVRPGHVNGDQLLVLASNVTGCEAAIGEWEDGPEFNGGDRSGISGLGRVEMRPGVAYAGDACGFLHESVPVDYSCARTVVRLNLELQ